MILKTQEQIIAMQEGGKILSTILKELADTAKPGMTTQALDDLARQRIIDNGVESSFLGYNNYPAVLCASINEEAVHAIPSGRTLKIGDLLKLDFGVVHKGLHTDAAVTVLIKEKNPREEDQGKLELMKITREALYAGISKARVGNTIGDIGEAIQKHVEENGYTIVHELGGHGIGTTLHEAPWIANFGEAGKGEKLVAGQAIALEPIVATGSWKIKDGDDGHAYIMKDGSLSAHYEHTVIVTNNGPLVVTE